MSSRYAAPLSLTLVLATLFSLCIAQNCEAKRASSGSRSFSRYRHSPSTGTSAKAATCSLTAESSKRLQFVSELQQNQKDSSPSTPHTVIRSMQELVQFYEASRHPSSAAFLSLEETLFEPIEVVARGLSGLSLRANWEQRLANLTRDLLEHRLITMDSKSSKPPRHHRLHGVYLGSDLVWRNISYHNLTLVSNHVQEVFASSTVGGLKSSQKVQISYSESLALFSTGKNINGMPTNYPNVPAAIDLLQIDATAHTGGADDNSSTESKDAVSVAAVQKRLSKSRWMVENLVYPKLATPKQLVVPVFPTISATNDLTLSHSLQFFANWINADRRVGGVVNVPSALFERAILRNTGLTSPTTTAAGEVEPPSQVATTTRFPEAQKCAQELVCRMMDRPCDRESDEEGEDENEKR